MRLESEALTETMMSQISIRPAVLPHPEHVAGKRPGAQVMSPEGMQAAYPNALSFSRMAIAEFVRRQWNLERLRVDLDEVGKGEALYRVVDGDRVFHLFVISQQLADEQKGDRNFATAWDIMMALCEGSWSDDRERRLREELPKQANGWFDSDTIMIGRANRSARLFDTVVDSLAKGQQPDPKVISEIGYIVRTTGFIGNGVVGTKPHDDFADEHPLARPYYAQMCTAFMLREFVFDLIDTMAAHRSKSAVRLAPCLRRFLGLGNSAATGLTRFLTNHPAYMHRWASAWEAAFATAKMRSIEQRELVKLSELVMKAETYFREDEGRRDAVFTCAADVAAGLSKIVDRISDPPHPMPRFFLKWLCEWSEANCSLEATEILHGIILELFPDIVSHFSHYFEADESQALDPHMTIDRLRGLVSTRYGWLDRWNWEEHDTERYFWFHSVDAPYDARRGHRWVHHDIEYENTLESVRQIRLLSEHLKELPGEMPVADFVAVSPQFCAAVARVQTWANCDYAEMRDNPLREGFLPFASIRKVLAYFGMERFESAKPKVVRGSLLQGAPTAEDVAKGLDGDWPFPLTPRNAGLLESDTLPPLRPLPVPSLYEVRQDRESSPAEVSGIRASDQSFTVSRFQFLRFAGLALQASGLELGEAAELSRLFLADQLRNGTGLRDILELSKTNFRYGPRKLRHLSPHEAVLETNGAPAVVGVLHATNVAVSKALSCGTALLLVGGFDRRSEPSMFAALQHNAFDCSVHPFEGSEQLPANAFPPISDEMENWIATARSRSPDERYLLVVARRRDPTMPARRYEEAAHRLTLDLEDWKRLLVLSQKLLIPRDVEKTLREPGFEASEQF